MGPMRFCHSCTAPLDSPEFKGTTDNYCKHCTDEAGSLKPRHVIQAGIAQWLKTWQPGIDDVTAMVRADHYMRALPAWAD